MNRACPLFLISVLTAGDVCAQLPRAGNYAILVCRDGCNQRDSTRAYLAGTLVLAEPAAIGAMMTAVVPTYRGGDITDIDGHSIDGCFSVTLRQRQDDSYAGIAPWGLFAWREDKSGEFRFSLYRSPDAGYTVKARASGDLLTGSGESWGVGVTEIAAPQDSVLAWWIGPPDTGPCIEAWRSTGY